MESRHTVLHGYHYLYFILLWTTLHIWKTPPFAAAVQTSFRLAPNNHSIPVFTPRRTKRGGLNMYVYANGNGPIYGGPGAMTSYVAPAPANSPYGRPAYPGPPSYGAGISAAGGAQYRPPAYSLPYKPPYNPYQNAGLPYALPTALYAGPNQLYGRVPPTNYGTYTPYASPPYAAAPAKSPSYTPAMPGTFEYDSQPASAYTPSKYYAKPAPPADYTVEAPAASYAAPPSYSKPQYAPVPTYTPPTYSSPPYSSPSYTAPAAPVYAAPPIYSSAPYSAPAPQAYTRYTYGSDTPSCQCPSCPTCPGEGFTESLSYAWNSCSEKSAPLYCSLAQCTTITDGDYALYAPDKVSIPLCALAEKGYEVLTFNGCHKDTGATSFNTGLFQIECSPPLISSNNEDCLQVSTVNKFAVETVGTVGCDAYKMCNEKHRCSIKYSPSEGQVPTSTRFIEVTISTDCTGCQNCPQTNTACTKT